MKLCVCAVHVMSHDVCECVVIYYCFDAKCANVNLECSHRTILFCVIHVRGACEFLLFRRRLLRPTVLRHTADTYIRAYVLMVGVDCMHV